jgi:hypothetical protein
MEVEYAEGIRERREEFALLEQASALLTKSVSRQSSPSVKAEWHLLPSGAGKTEYRLTIRDSYGQVSSDFTLDELRNSLHMRFRIPRLWGDLLQIRSDQHWREIERLSSQIASGQEVE